MSSSFDSLEQDGISNRSSFMDIQPSLSLSQHQPYSSIRSSYSSGAQSAHEAFAQVQSSRSLSGYPFSSMNNSPLHSAYPHHAGHSYLGSCGPCQPCPSPPRDVTTSPGSLLSSHCNYSHSNNNYDHMMNGPHPPSSTSSSVHYSVRNVYHPYNYGTNYMTSSSDVILPFLPIVGDSAANRLSSDQELSNDISVCEEKSQSIFNGEVIKRENEGLNSVLSLNSSNRPQPPKSPFEWMNKPSYQSQQQPGKTRTRDKYRVVYSDHQRLELEKEFHSSHYITIKRKSELAFSLQLSERQVKIWFQNRRAKERKQLKKKEEVMNKSRELHPTHPQLYHYENVL